jgi:hypothetical protein
MSALHKEVNYLKEARGYGTIEALDFIDFYQKEFPSEIRRELEEIRTKGIFYYYEKLAK